MYDLAQLTTGDVRTFDGRLCLLITDEDEDGQGTKSLKNRNSRRLVPVHNDLLTLGLADYAGGKGRGRLFPELKPDSRGHYGTDLSTEFIAHLDAIGINDDAARGRAVFHSFRHSMVDALRRRYRKADVELLTGHTTTMIDGYTHVVDTTLALKIEMIDALDYGLDLSNICQSSK